MTPPDRSAVSTRRPGSPTDARNGPAFLWSLGDQPDGYGPQVVEQIAPWVVAASRPFADWYFGEPWAAAEILTEWMNRPTSEVFAGRAIVYEDTDGPGGCIIALPGRDVARCRAADFAAFCEEIALEPEADEVITEIVAASSELFAPVEDDDCYISRVGVAPDRQGRGIGRTMVSHVLEGAARQGYRRVRLDVSADNEPARRAYEAVGLRVVETRHSPTAGLTYCSMIATL